MIRREGTHAALLARASWNSYENTCPVAPTVRAIEWVKEPEPVPGKKENEKGQRIIFLGTKDVQGREDGSETLPASITTLPGLM